VPLVVAMVLIGVYHAVRRDDRGPALYLAIVGVGVIAINNALKLIVDRDRPDVAQLAGHAGSSFPSGHSAAAAACWAAIALVVARRASRRVRLVAGTLAAVIAVVVAATRVLLGVHWLTDVVAGVVVGWTWFLLSTIVFGGHSLRLGEPAERIAAEAADPNDHRACVDQREETSA
jgi:undecaprenyl-diphosphatase